MSAVQEVIPASVVQAQRQEQRSLLRRIAEQYGVDPEKMLATLKSTAFRIRDGEVSNEQMMALLIVADAHKLNPFTREIFAFPSQNGVVPVVSVDGWAKLVNDHPQFNGWEFDQDDEKCTCTIYRRDREHPTKVTEYMAECKRPTGPWGSHPKRMLRHKALIQAARYAFSFSGIFDPDEAEAIAENEIDVTPTGKLSPRKLREAVEGIIKATENKDGDGLLKIWNPLTNDEKQYLFSELRSYERRAVRNMLDLTAKTNGFGDLPSWSIELLKSCKNAAELDKAWKSIQDAFQEADQEVPDNVTVTCDEMRSSMGAV